MLPPDPDRQIFNIATRYAAVGRCIYAPVGETHCGHLEIEHIIPLAMQGSRELPASSCRKCAETINKFETRYFRGTMETARDHMGLKGRQKHKRRDRLPIRFMDGGTMSIPIDQHPSVLIMPQLLRPGFRAGFRPSDDLEIGVTPHLSPMTSDLHQRAYRIGKPINLTRGIDALDCYRQIAKIAHAFAVAELGLGGIASLLLNLIYGRPPMLAAYLIGSSSTHEPPSDQLHEIGFGDPFYLDGHEMVVVRIRLFAFLSGSPTHFALVGVRPPPMPDRNSAM
jgi:hypothetical protein